MLWWIALLPLLILYVSKGGGEKEISSPSNQYILLSSGHKVSLVCRKVDDASVVGKQPQASSSSNNNKTVDDESPAFYHILGLDNLGHLNPSIEIIYIV